MPQFVDFFVVCGVDGKGLTKDNASGEDGERTCGDPVQRPLVGEGPKRTAAWCSLSLLCQLYIAGWRHTRTSVCVHILYIGLVARNVAKWLKAAGREGERTEQ